MSVGVAALVSILMGMALEGGGLLMSFNARHKYQMFAGVLVLLVGCTLIVLGVSAWPR